MPDAQFPDAHETPEAIQWHEGMLLAPPHFQQFALRQEALLHYHTMAIAPFHWGVRRLKIDPGLLVNGTLRVLALEAVMPDGLVVSLPPDPSSGIELDLVPYVEDLKMGAAMVHLAVPAQRLSGGPVKGELPRYDSVEGDAVPDENTGEGEIRIPRLRPRLSLLVTETPPKKYVSIPLAGVTYQNETFSLTDFIPPSLLVPVQSEIGEICSLIVKRLREKAGFLSEKIRSSASTLEMPLILEMKGLVQSLVSNLPPLEGVLYTGVAHPYALYLALCGVVGHLAALGPSLIPPVLSPYNHNDLRFTFEQIRDFAFRMIDEGILESYTAIPFQFEGGVFSLTFQGTWADMPLVLGVRRQPGQSERDVISWMEECLIGSQEKIPSMRDKRILGAVRKMLEEKDDELVAVGGTIFFSLRADPEFIASDEMLQVLNTGDPIGARRPAEILLYVRNVT